ncbi:MAG: hypothetical protein LBG70_02415, partial [Bifidobacteriaceae bacterium]|nr:hypothetical protein [Bifidobacteriaceae bacterium]
MAMNFSQWGNDLYTGKRSYNVVGKRRAFFTVSLVVILICGFLIFKPGLTAGIEFRGGSEFRVITTGSTIDQAPAEEAVHQVAPEEEVHITKVGSGSLRIQTQELTDAQTKQVTTA